MNTIPCYVNGRTYRALHTRFSRRPRPFDCSRDRVLAITSPALTWSRLWQVADTTLQHRGYGSNTRRLYRAVLRRFAAFSGGTPAQATSATVTAFVRDVGRRNGSWAWTGMNISVLRTVFDKIGGRTLVTGLRTPKRPQRLRVRSGRNTRERKVALPPDLLAVLELGVARCPAADFVFQGRRAGAALSIRRMELILREAVAAACPGSGITAMSLRHAFAVHCLEEGASPRALQEALGHESLARHVRLRDRQGRSRILHASGAFRPTRLGGGHPTAVA